MMRSIVVALVVVFACGCQKAPAVSRGGSVAPAVGALTTQLKDDGDALAKNGDYEGAAAKYRAAANQEPASIPIRYALGVALSYLDRRDETAEQFRWVMSRAPRGSHEYLGARSWLASAGALEAQAQDPSEADAGPSDGKSERASNGRLSGHIDWGGLDPHDRHIQARLFLSGEDDATREVKRERPARIGGRYEFRDLPPGKYRLHARALETELWDRVVTVEAGQEAILDFTQRNSDVAANDFPPREDK